MGWVAPVGIVVLAVLAGCGSPAAKTPLASDPLPAAGPPRSVEGDAENLTFEPPVLIDSARPGGEPVILATPKGTLLVAAHPGWTHLYVGGQPAPNFPRSVTGQNMLWRSTDDGKSWSFVGLPDVAEGPRDAAIGTSDPDLAIDDQGTVFLVSLSIPSLSISRSTDDGRTWVGRVLVETEPFPENDRPWVAARGDARVWIAARGNVWRSQAGSGGLVYEQVLNQDDAWWSWWSLALDRADGTLYFADHGWASYSTDEGRTWGGMPADRACRGQTTSLVLAKPAVDDAGNVYTATACGDDKQIHYSAWARQGRLFYGDWRLANESGIVAWPWVVAGADGRIAVVWLASDGRGFDDSTAKWYLWAGIVTEAHSSKPKVQVARAAAEPIHVGALCQGGTYCAGLADRRLGDFLTAAIDREGRLTIVAGATHATGSAGSDDDLVSHPIFIRQATGPRLRAVS